MRALPIVIGIHALLPLAWACDGCSGPPPHREVEHVRLVRRMQPGARNAAYGPTRPLEWGQLNVLHTTDTHGWLEGHLLEQNYGADWGDYASFVRHMKQKATALGVDLLLIDTGDLHDGAGLSEATSPDGVDSNAVFAQVDDYDLLTIGNHELYVTEVAYETFANFSKRWGDRYLTSNVQIFSPSTGLWEYVGNTYRYFTTPHGLRVMAFGVLFDFTGNSNVSKVTTAATMVQQEWFAQALSHPKPIDLFLLIGHNPARPNATASTFATVQRVIRQVHPHTPIQIFGGHSHIRDFAVYDQSSTALEAGRYCETLGFFSMSGFDSTNSGFQGPVNPRGVPNPARKATSSSTAPFVYSRRYLDWNRLTFEYHASGSQATNASDDASSSLDTPKGVQVTKQLTNYYTQLGLGKVYGCVPALYCMTCVPFLAERSIFGVLADALATVVVSRARPAGAARLIIANTGSIRFDLHKGPFRPDENFNLSPFRNVFLFLPDVPFSVAGALLSKLNAVGAGSKKRKRQGGYGGGKTTRETRWQGGGAGVIGSPGAGKRFASTRRLDGGADACVDPAGVSPPLLDLLLSGNVSERAARRGKITRRQQLVETPGYTTTDDFGSDGDDTAHAEIPVYPIPACFQATAGFPASGTPGVVDLIFADLLESDILAILGSNYTEAQVKPYVSSNFTVQDYIIPYVQAKWQAGMPNCPVSSTS